MVRRSRLVPLAFLAILVAGRGVDAKDAKPSGAPKVASVPNDEYPAPFRAAVQKAIERGVAWLKTQQTPDGRFEGAELSGYPFGEAALATFTLLESGVAPDDPVVAKALGVLREATPETTYENALCCLAIGAIADAVGDPFAEDAVDARGRPVVRAAARERLGEADVKGLLRWVGFLRKHQSDGTVLADRAYATPGDGGWGYGRSTTLNVPVPKGVKVPKGAAPPPPVVILDFPDASNTQYALLGLKAAARCGVAVPASVWRRALDFVLACQAERGAELELRANEIVGRQRLEWRVPARARGFGYAATGTSDGTGSMTAAGVAGVAICRSELEKSPVWTPELDQSSSDAMRDGLAWLQKRFTVTRNPGNEAWGSAWVLYYLYGVERAGTLSRTRFLGTHDWYLEGAKELLGEQLRDGSFASATVDTCFALLFLRRATVRTSTRVITPKDPPALDGGAPAAPAAPAADAAMGASAPPR